MATLIIAEKPSVALRLATALADGAPEKKRGVGRSSYYEFQNEGKKVFVATAVGHIFTIRQASGGRGYPVLDVEWAPSFQVSKTSEFTKDYHDTLREVAARCDFFINACDFDIEGTVIGTNVLTFLAKNALRRAKRMKFSTTTSKDLVSSYRHLLELDMNNFQAGEARHMLDWLWGINISRALTGAVRGSSMKMSLSIGRVQGPALAMLARREIEISKFIPRPFWKLSMPLEKVEFTNVRGEIFDKQVATAALDETRRNFGNAFVESVEATAETLYPNPPFDLTSLQVEASRTMRIDPSETLKIAQALYERSFISYPRTSSQKLPATLGLPEIIEELAKNPAYAGIANALLQAKRFKPLEGVKEDEAHPAIFPTGIRPSELTDGEQKIYDMIARRFLACFAEPAAIERTKVTVKLGGERYTAMAKRIAKKGWLAYYPYARVEESSAGSFRKDEKVKPTEANMRESQTQPPRRYTKAGAIAELEKRGLGTKATRAAVIDTLARRKYIDGESIIVTMFGLSVYEALKENCGMIVDDQTTRRLEDDMELIAKGEKKEKEVIDEGKQLLLEALNAFEANRSKVTESLRKGFNDMNVLGPCPADKGELVIRWSKAGKRFAGCSNYPKCTRTYSLPQKGKIMPTGRVCEGCKTPIISVLFMKGRKLETDLDQFCPLRKKEAGAEQMEKAVFRPKVEIAAHLLEPKKPAAAGTVAKVAKAAPEPKEQRTEIQLQKKERKPRAKAAGAKTRKKGDNNG